MIRKFRGALIALAVLIIFASIPTNLNSVFAAATQDSLFTEVSTEFNLDLAKYSLTLSSAAYGNTCTTIEKMLTKYGFTNDTVYDKASYKKSNKLGTDSVGYSFASKKISCNNRDYTLVAVVIRGTSGDNEWISNFNINNSGNSPTIHEGFSKAETALLTDLNSYMKSLNLAKSSTKFLITGHSRGGAVANLLAAYLSKTAKLANPSDIYGYTFAAPNVAKVENNTYLNIFNAVNPADIVTEIPLADWGYSKYGVTYLLPDEQQLNAEDLAAAKKALSQLTTMAPTVKDFYKNKLSLVLLKDNFIPSGTTSKHAPKVYMNYLNDENADELSDQIFDLQLRLLPDIIYAKISSQIDIALIPIQKDIYFV